MFARAQRNARHRSWHTAAYCVLSIILGAGFGVVAAVGMRMAFMADIALIYGAVAGFLFSPVLVFGLRRGPVMSGLAWIAAPTITAAYVGGAITPPNGGPFLSMVVAISVYVLASFVRGVVGLKYYRPPPAGACQSCAYDLKGLSDETTCPECGASRTRTGQT